MSTVITILILVVCILLTLVVLIQNSKGGGLSSQFSSSNQMMGVRRTTDFLEKATWSLVGALFLLCMISPAFNNKNEAAAPSQSEIKDFVNAEAVAPPAGFEQQQQPTAAEQPQQQPAQQPQQTPAQ